MLGISETQGSTNDSLDEEAIVDRIYEAVIERQLPAGTKLSETALCDAFGVGRMRIRRSLLLLASRNIVDLQSNRGAYIASPTQDEAREVFQARRAIEPNVCRIATEQATTDDVDLLADHLNNEHAAHSAGDRRLAIRLSGLFHVKLSEISGNSILTRTVKELVTRTSLIIGLFGAAGTENCRADEHSKLLTAIRVGESAEAAEQMIAHLRHIESQIYLSTDQKRAVDLVEIFGKK